MVASAGPDVAVGDGDDLGSNFLGIHAVSTGVKTIVGVSGKPLISGRMYPHRGAAVDLPTIHDFW